MCSVWSLASQSFWRLKEACEIFFPRFRSHSFLLKPYRYSARCERFSYCSCTGGDSSLHWSHDEIRVSASKQLDPFCLKHMLNLKETPRATFSLFIVNNSPAFSTTFIAVRLRRQQQTTASNRNTNERTNKIWGHCSSNVFSLCLNWARDGRLFGVNWQRKPNQRTKGSDVQGNILDTAWERGRSLSRGEKWLHYLRQLW